MVRHCSSMMFFARCLSPLVGILLVIPSMRAFPGDIVPPCSTHHYIFKRIATSSVHDGTSFQSFSCPGGGTLRYLSGAATSVTFTVGAELKLQLSEIFKAGVSGSVSFTTTTASAGSAGMRCPDGPWTCALIVIPKIHTVTGQARRLGSSPDCAAGDWTNFALNAPDVDNNNVANLGVEICTCKNKSGWAAPGHISRLCDKDC